MFLLFKIETPTWVSFSVQFFIGFNQKVFIMKTAAVQLETMSRQREYDTLGLRLPKQNHPRKSLSTHDVFLLQEFLRTGNISPLKNLFLYGSKKLL